MGKRYYVYIMADKPYGTLYTGITSDLARRVWEHKTGACGGFTKRYKCHKLVYYDVFDQVDAAIAYEKKLKKYRRDWKINLIQAQNRIWRDLYETLNQ